MSIHLTSFKRYHDDKWTMPGVSIAVYQPKWYPQLPKIDYFDIRNEKGSWIRPRDFVPPNHDRTKFDFSIVEAYATELIHQYHLRYTDIWDWLKENQLFQRSDIALCCWCPHDKAAGRQIKDFGTYVCHSAVVEKFLNDHFDVDVIRDKERGNMVQL